jgi:hypothetical protein
MTTNEKKNGIIFLIACVAIPVLYGIFQDKSLKKHLAFTHGTISDVYRRIKDAGIGFQYDFVCANGQKITHTTFYGCNSSITIKEIRKIVLNRQFPVVYDSLDCGITYMVFDKNRIAQFNIASRLTEEDKANIALMARICNH